VTKLIKAVCNKVIKKNKGFLPARPASFATVYHNKEFMEGGFAVETVQVIAPKAMKLPIRKRKHCGDGSSLDRAW
ncbi:HERC1, partial [Symbiodinium sp. KB8]